MCVCVCDLFLFLVDLIWLSSLLTERENSGEKDTLIKKVTVGELRRKKKRNSSSFHKGLLQPSQAAQTVSAPQFGKRLSKEDR